MIDEASKAPKRLIQNFVEVIRAHDHVGAFRFGYADYGKRKCSEDESDDLRKTQTDAYRRLATSRGASRVTHPERSYPHCIEAPLDP